MGSGGEVKCANEESDGSGKLMNVRRNLQLHGENGITFQLFSELSKDARKLVYFLEHVEWATKPELSEDSKFEIHLFPSFGRKTGLGEPDVIIIFGNNVFYVELETTKIENLQKEFFKQFFNFIRIGETLKTSGKRKVRKYFDFGEGKRARGLFRTRKLITDLLNRPHEAFYIVVSNDSPKCLTRLLNRLGGERREIPRDRIGWISYRSVKRFKNISRETVDTINLNLKE